MRILENVSCHNDLVSLNAQQRKQLCGEIRAFLVAHLAETGGHLASNLGAVELTVAIETVFDTEKDRLVFDVGHQSYIHKLLTGRQTDFAHLRQFGGIAGFPKPSESNTDAFVAGHASSSVSIALGMARARTLLQEDYNVIALLGDGAATGGMAYEGLNDAAVSKEPMIIILNDNEMSIDQNVGGLAKHLSRLRTKDRYLGMKDQYRKFLRRIPGGKGIYRVTRSMKDWFKRMFLRTTMFENMGLTYLGPVDGHDLEELIRILRAAKRLNEPVLIHVLTQKGHGYAPAEENPSKFHGVSKFDPRTGKTASKGKMTFSDRFGDTMVRLAAEEPSVCAITAAMPGGTGLLKFKEKYPNRLFDVGIAEEHAVSMAGGLAKQGMIPVVALYSTFLQRAYDQILQDIAILKLHVVLAVDRAGLVGEDGETHHGVFDVGFLRQIPGLRLMCPGSGSELADMLQWAVKEYTGPVAIRYPRGGDRIPADSGWKNDRELISHRHGESFAILTYGTITENALTAAGILAEKGIEVSVVRLLTLAPLPKHAIVEAVGNCKNVLVLEEAMASSGIFSDVARLLPAHNVISMNLGDQFVTHGCLDDLYRAYGLDAASIANKVTEVLKNEN